MEQIELLVILMLALYTVFEGMVLSLKLRQLCKFVRMKMLSELLVFAIFTRIFIINPASHTIVVLFAPRLP